MDEEKLEAKREFPDWEPSMKIWKTGKERIEQRRTTQCPPPPLEALSYEERYYLHSVETSSRRWQEYDDDALEMSMGCVLGLGTLILAGAAITSPIWGPVVIYQSLRDKYLKRRN